MAAPLNLKKSRLRNYKACLDSGDCWLSPKITILAGKNESGKTAVLVGFDRLYNGQTISENEYSLLQPGVPPSAIVTFEVAEHDFEDLVSDLGTGFTLTFREYLLKHGASLLFRANEEPTLHGEVPEWFLDTAIDEETLPLVQRIPGSVDALAQELATINGALNPYGHNITTEAKDTTAAEVRSQLEIAASLTIPEPTQAALVTNGVASARAMLPEQKAAPTSFRERFIEAVLKRRPPVIFFSDEDDLIPFEIPLSNAQANAGVRRLARVADLDLEKIQAESNTLARKNLTSGKTAQVSAAFQNSWLQQKLRIIFDTNGDNLLIEVMEEGSQIVYAVDQRSKGLQWYLSFYTRLKGEPIDGAVILIDEPGLYLHAKAQKNLLDELERATERVQKVIFSTHSPYLIDASHTDRVRPVVRDENTGTRVDRKIHADADFETLTPILTAIGDEVGSGINNINKENNVVLEGPSDPLFLRAAAMLCERMDILTLHLIGCMGASKVPQVCSILRGWGVSHIALFDNDRAGKQAYNEMKKAIGDDAQCYLLPGGDGAGIEDQFSRDFFIREVLGGSGDSTKGNSKQMNDVGDKVIRAKKFLERVEHNRNLVQLDDETKKLLEPLFTLIVEKLV